MIRTKNKTDADRLNEVVARAVAGMKPPENLTVTEWADKYRRLSPESSAEPGPWRTSRTPYLKAIMDSFTDSKIRNIVFVSSAQIGKTEVELNIVGYIIDQDPGSILFIVPTLGQGKEFSKLRIAPMFRDCTTLKSKVADPKSRDSANTILQKSYPGGILTITGSTEAHALASKPIRYIMGDERDRWAMSAGTEGDPWELARARQLTFYNAKAVEVSTPTIKNASAIARSFAKGTMERWCTECPHCGEYHNIVFADIRFEYEEKIVSGEKTFTVTEVYYICPGCGCISSEREMKKQPAKWIAKSPAAYKNGVRSFWLNSFVSPWVTWESTIVKYLEAKDNSRELQAVYNTRFGELWEDRGNLMGESDLLARREDYEAELPDGVLVLTCGVDTQDDRLEYEVVGFGHFGESWGIKKGIIMGRPDEDDVWADLDDVISHVYRFASGVGLRISLTFVDEGGHFTQDVRLRCSARLRRNMFAIAGSNRHDDPYTAPPKKQKIVIDGKVVGMCWQYRIGVDAGKQIITDNLRVQTPGSRYSHFPRRDDYGPAYFTGLLSERLEYNTKKKQPWEWVKLPGHERNEALDCRNYALAAVRALAPDFDAADRRLKAARTGQSPAATAASKPAAKKTRKPKPSEPNTKKYYDDW